MGSLPYTSRSRENLVVGAKFLRDDLPYFVEVLAEVAQQTKYLGASMPRSLVSHAFLLLTAS